MRTTSYDVVRPRIYYVCRLVHTNNKMATEDDVYDIVLAISCLYAYGEFSRRRHRQTRPRRFSVHDALRRRDDLGVVLLSI